jgi:hypothetical protein
MPKIPLTHANIIHILGIEFLPLDERKEIVESTLELVETRAFNRVMASLKKSQRAKFAKLVESEELDEVAKFLEKDKIDLLAIFEEEIEKVKHELLEVAKER